MKRSSILLYITFPILVASSLFTFLLYGWKLSLPPLALVWAIGMVCQAIEEATEKIIVALNEPAQYVEVKKL